MADLLLVLNAGSSSLKFTIFTEHGKKLEIFVSGQIEGINTKPHFIARNNAGVAVHEMEWPPGRSISHEGALEALFDWGREYLGGPAHIGAVGHRVVHGGLKYTKPVLVDEHVLADLQRIVPLMPLHQPHNLAPIRFIRERSPATPQVACFDTSFHAGTPILAQTYGLPRKLTGQGVRRYGFHGISYEYIAQVLPGIDPEGARGRTVVAHLGNGASMCAMKGLGSLACTLGFSSVDGLVMGTRCGTLDPVVLLYLMEMHGMDARALENLLHKESGLLGVSGISSDMKTLLASTDPRAAEAVDLFIYRITRELGSLAAALGGLDALVFTGGIGEKAAPIRERVCRDAAWLGLALDEEANARGGPRISRQGSRVRAWVIPTDEELMIARHTRDLAGAQRA
jgi:acetate kinase